MNLNFFDDQYVFIPKHSTEYENSKMAVRIITLNRYNSHREPLFLKLQILKIEDQLKLQELTFCYKYIHRNLPVYLLNWKIMPNYTVIVLATLQIYIHLGQYMIFQTKS